MPFPIILKDKETGQRYLKDNSLKVFHCGEKAQAEIHYKWNPETLKNEQLEMDAVEVVQESAWTSLKSLAEKGLNPFESARNGTTGDIRSLRNTNIQEMFKSTKLADVLEEVGAEEAIKEEKPIVEEEKPKVEEQKVENENNV